MKTNSRQIRIHAAMLAALLFTQAAYAFYNPATGRWLSRDPIEEEGGINIYTFVANDPILQVDEDGRLAWVYRGSSGQEKHECGGWSSAWLLTGINGTKPVWVVSKITENYDVKTCLGYGWNGPVVWWEALKIRGSFRDLDAMGDYDGYYGKQSDTIVTAVFPDVEPYSSDIPKWGHQAPASGTRMFSTYTPPLWWGRATETATRSESSDWSCCCWRFTTHDWSPK